MRCFSYAARINSFKARSDLYDWNFTPLYDIRDLIDRAENVKGLDGIALNYPEHIETNVGLKGLKGHLASSSLEIDAINVRFNSGPFLFGGFTNPDHSVRRDSIDLCKRAIDVCRELGSDHLILWLSEDGFNYPFQADICQMWEYEIEGIREVALYGNDIRVSIEYKPFDSGRVSLIGSLASTIIAIDACECPNIGITLDYCHLLIGKEYPAISVFLAGAAKKLYGVHLNDGYGFSDDGLMVGTVNPIQTLEFLFYLMKIKYEGTIYFDTFPVREDPVAECERNINWTEAAAEELLDVATQIEAAQVNRDAVAIYKTLASMEFGF